MPTGEVARFDARRGYGFVTPEDGGEDVFVHQNNINMEGFRYLKVGERVSYELEVGEKGMKAIDVTLLSEREPDTYRPRRNDGPGAYRSDRRSNGRHYQQRDDEGLRRSLDQMRRKHERLISLLVEKGILAPGEIDGVDAYYTNDDEDDEQLDDDDGVYATNSEHDEA